MRGARFIVFVTALVLAFAALSAQAQSTKFVSVTGSDTDPCDVATPCRTIGAAITAVAANGRVTILTSGEYAPFAVDKAVTVAAADGVDATIVQAGMPAEAIRVTAPANTNVVLRGLTILTRLTGTFTYGGRGITTANANLHVEHCVLDGPFVTAVRITSGRAYISNTVVRGAMDEEAILQLGPSEAWYERLHLDSTALIGLKVESAGARAVVRDSTFMKANAGVRALGGGHAIIENSGFSLNGVAIAADAGSRVTVSNSLIANNGTGIGGTGTRVTFGNNRFAGNTTNGTFTITAALR